MLELGQPLHAFDAAKLDGSLQARLARAGEEFLALDGKRYQLAAHQLVIADSAKAVAIAGVMGGQESGVEEGTTDIWLESARFQPQSIRRTSRQLALAVTRAIASSVACDPEGVISASERALELILELAGGTAEPLQMGAPEGVQADREAPIVPLRPERVKLLLGAEVAESRIEAILTGFGLRKTSQGWQSRAFALI
jgi:phenylalanyl-tRNA synthetase beta chain